MSKSDSSKITPLGDRISIGNLKPTQHGIQSCKLLCYQIPFCKSYEYFMYDDSCNLFSNRNMDNYYKTLIDRIKQSNSDSNFNLIHLLQGDLLNKLEENLNFNNSIVIDKKVYPDCESKPMSADLGEELHCRDDLADFNEIYELDDLVPLTSYQFRLEVANAFGKSLPILSEIIEIPFPLNPIVEHEPSDKHNFYSLECSTSLTETAKLQFKWYRNQQLIDLNDTNFRLVTKQPSLNDQVFSSVLEFQGDAKKLSGFYTCSLCFVDDFIHLAKNESLVFIPTSKFFQLDRKIKNYCVSRVLKP